MTASDGRRRGHAACAAALLLATAALYGPVLVHDALPVAPFSDTAFHVQATRAWDAGRAEGAWWPRWADAMNRGWGAPLFVLYPPVAHGLAAGLSPGGDVLVGLRLAVGVFALLGGLAFFGVARTRLPTAAALAGALLYTVLPYRAVDLYQRFALAEFAAFVWLPGVFHFAARVVERPGRRSALGLAVCSAGLALTHIVSAWMTALVLLAYLGARLSWRPAGAGIVRPAAALVGAALGAALLAAAYVVPALVERDQAHFEYMTEEPRYDWRRNFTFRDEVAHGYARAPLKPWANAAASSQLLICLAAFAVAAPRLRRRDAMAGETAGLAAVAALAFVLQLAVSAPLWEHVPELSAVQFPWRFAALQGFAACGLLALAVARVQALERSRRRALLALSLGAAVLPAVAVSGASLGEAQFRFDAEVAARRAANVVFEYLPQGVAGWKTFASAEEAAAPRVAIVAGQGRIRETRWGAQRRRFTVDADEDVRVRLRTFYWPGWGGRVDSAPATVAPGGPQRGIEIAVPRGTHTVDVAFGSTPLRSASMLCSAAAWLLAAALAVAWRRRAHST